MNSMSIAENQVAQTQARVQAINEPEMNNDQKAIMEYSRQLKKISAEFDELTNSFPLAYMIEDFSLEKSKYFLVLDEVFQSLNNLKECLDFLRYDTNKITNKLIKRRD